jgi:cell wall-associated NlpC family hydrolase
MSPAPCPSHPGPPGRRPGAWLAVLLLSVPAVALAQPQSDPLIALLAERGEWPAARAPTISERAADLVIAAMNFVGMPYHRGGNTASTGFDCSGFTRHIFALSLGLALPRRADEQADAKGLVRVDKGDLRAGDLVFFNTMKRRFSHVGIYIGDGRFIHSPKTGSEVRIDDMRYAYWSQRYSGARRAMMAGSAASGETTPLATPN